MRKGQEHTKCFSSAPLLLLSLGRAVLIKQNSTVPHSRPLEKYGHGFCLTMASLFHIHEHYSPHPLREMLYPLSCMNTYRKAFDNYGYLECILLTVALYSITKQFGLFFKLISTVF